MPVILDEAGAGEWVGAEALPPDKLLSLCQPYRGEMIRVDQPLSPRGKITTDDLKLFAE